MSVCIRTNMLISRFRHCSKSVKLILFRSFCLCMYDVALWKYFSVTAFRKFRAAYNKYTKNCLVMQDVIVCPAF